MNLVLDEEVYQGHESAEEGAGNVLAVLDRLCVGRAQQDTASRPGKGEYDV